MVRHSDVLAMVVEASSLNWISNGATVNPITGETGYMARLAARHGQKSDRGCNAYTNIAFFDGHVTLVATQPLDYYIDSTGAGGDQVIPVSLQRVVFTLGQDQTQYWNSHFRLNRNALLFSEDIFGPLCVLCVSILRCGPKRNDRSSSFPGRPAGFG